MKFDVGDVVQCLWGSGTLKYEAKVVKADPTKPKTPYLVHYQGWNDRWDEWVPEKRLIGSPSNKKPQSSAASTPSSSKTSAVVTNSKKSPHTPASSSKRAPSPPKSSRSTKGTPAATGTGTGRVARPAAPQDISLATPAEEEAATNASSFEPIEPPPAAPVSKPRSPPKRAPPQKSGQGTVKAAPAEDLASDVREIQKAVSPPVAVSVAKSKSPPKSPRKTAKAAAPGSHFAEEISAEMFHQLSRPNEEEPDFSQFQEPEDVDAPSPSKARARRQSRPSEGEPDSKRRRAGQETVKPEMMDKKPPIRRVKKAPTEDQQAAMYLSVANAALANEMDEGTEFIEIQEPLEPQPVAPSMTMSGAAPVVAAAKRPPTKPKTAPVRRQPPDLKRPQPPTQQTMVMSAAEYEQHVSGVHDDQEQQHFEPMMVAHGHGHHHHHHGGAEFVEQDDGVNAGGRYASLQGITVTGSAPAPEAPSRVIMKLKAAPDSRSAAARAAAQKFKTPLRVGPDGMEYIDQYYSPQLHVGGRGRFGVIGQGPPPAQPIPDKPEDFSYLPPEIVSDHCYGKTPPAAGSSQSGQQVYHGGDIGQYGRGRLVPAHLLPTANLSYHQPAVYRSSRVGAVTYQTTSRLRVTQQRSPSPLGYRGAGEGGFALSDEGLVEGYVDANGMEVVGFDGGQMGGVTVSMMAGGSLIGVDRMPANILDDGDELAETSIDIQ